MAGFEELLPRNPKASKVHQVSVSLPLLAASTWRTVQGSGFRGLGFLLFVFVKGSFPSARRSTSSGFGV